MYELREGRKMRPKTFAAMLSNLLYERRFGPFFVEPIVAGIDPATKEPYICNMDLIGNKTDPEDMVAEQIFESTSQALTNAFDRDSGAGWGAVVHVIEADKITTRKLKTRMD